MQFFWDTARKTYLVGFDQECVKKCPSFVLKKARCRSIRSALGVGMNDGRRHGHGVQGLLSRTDVICPKDTAEAAIWMRGEKE